MYPHENTVGINSKIKSCLQYTRVNLLERVSYISRYQAGYAEKNKTLMAILISQWNTIVSLKMQITDSNLDPNQGGLVLKLSRTIRIESEWPGQPPNESGGNGTVPAFNYILF